MVFADDGTALLLTGDHELKLNFFAAYDGFTYQQERLQRRPERLLRYVRNQPDPRLTLNIVDFSAHENSWVATSGVFWCDGTDWHTAQVEKLTSAC